MPVGLKRLIYRFHLHLEGDDKITKAYVAAGADFAWHVWNGDEQPSYYIHLNTWQQCEKDFAERGWRTMPLWVFIYCYAIRDRNIPQKSTYHKKSPMTENFWEEYCQQIVRKIDEHIQKHNYEQPYPRFDCFAREADEEPIYYADRYLLEYRGLTYAERIARQKEQNLCRQKTFNRAHNA